MLPNSRYVEASEDSIEEFIIESYPSCTYKIDYEKKRIIGFCDGREAIEQSIYKILNTERYFYSIYDWNYGIEWQDIIGADSDFILSELEDRIEDALLQDDRIYSITNFKVQKIQNHIVLSFTAETTEGEIKINREEKI